MNDIISAFQEQGFNPGEVVLDGKIHRFRVDKDDVKNSGWYVGFQNHTQVGGEVFQVVVFGSYRDAGIVHQYQTDRKYSAHDKRAIKEQLEKAKKVAEAQRAAAQVEVAREVQKLWEASSVEGTSEYLNRKLLGDGRDLGIRYDGRGTIFVPMRDCEGTLWSLQKIQWDGGKFFHPGGKVSGCFHVLGAADAPQLPEPRRDGEGGERHPDSSQLQESARLIICEGFATAASIYLSLGRRRTVVCAFNSGNLEAVAKSLRKQNPAAEIIIAGDEDLWSKKGDGTPFNPGREAAQSAAKTALGRAVFPRFKNPVERKTTDFNDLHVAEGIDAVKEQLEKASAPKLALYALGFKEKEYFFTSTQNRQVVGVSAFKESDMLGLMPLGYWEAMFPGKNDSGVNWTAAKSQIMEECRARGIFQARHVRGAGVWVDDGRIVVNMGDHLLVDGIRCDLGTLRSRYFYTLGEKLHQLHPSPLTTEECETFVHASRDFKWLKKESGMLLAGALVCSRVCGALPIRPHIWITGGAQTGKTTLFESLVNKIMGENKLYFLGSTSEAGVRQSVKADALPILFDEFETTDVKSAEKIASLIELMRASWAESGGVIVKGGSSGNASHFQVRFSAIVSSIRTRLTNDADKGRFAILELAPHGSDADHWRALSRLLAEIDAEYAERLFSRTIRLLPVLLQNFRTIKKALASKVDSRFGDQYGMLLAGYSILLSDVPVTPDDANWLADNIELQEEREVAKNTDHDDALTHLLTTSVQVDNGTVRRTALIGELIESCWKQKVQDPSEESALTRIGIRVESEFVAIATPMHADQEKVVWRGTRWSQAWGNSLKRLSGASQANLRFGGAQKKVVKIPIGHFLR